jgi:hypothetical protein
VRGFPATYLPAGGVGWDHAVARIKTLDHIFALQKLPQNRAWGPDPRGLDPSDSGGLFGRPLSLAVISVALSPHPKIPFLADKSRRGHEAFAARALNLGGVGKAGVFGACAIVADLTQAPQTADSILLEHRAAARY